MLEAFLYAFNAIVPMLLLMLLGFWLRSSGFFDGNTLKTINAFAFRFGISAMMFNSIYSLPSLKEIRLTLLVYVLISCVVLTALGWVSAQIFTNQRNRRGVMIQNSFRSNFAIIGILVASALGGKEGGAVAASMQAPAIIYYNVVAIFCLAVYSDRPDRAVSLRGILRELVTNPMLIGQIGGLTCLAVRELIPRGTDGTLIFSLSGTLPFLYAPISSLAAMASPLLLIIMGGQINFRAVGFFKKELVAGVIQRLVVAPIAGFGIAVLAQRAGLISLTPGVVSALVGLYGSPVAVASGVMAEEMGGDAELARQYVVWTAALSMITLLFWILLLRTTHML